MQVRTDQGVNDLLIITSGKSSVEDFQQDTLANPKVLKKYLPKIKLKIAAYIKDIQDGKGNERSRFILKQKVNVLKTLLIYACNPCKFNYDVLILAIKKNPFYKESSISCKFSTTKYLVDKILSIMKKENIHEGFIITEEKSVNNTYNPHRIFSNQNNTSIGLKLDIESISSINSSSLFNSGHFIIHDDEFADITQPPNEFQKKLTGSR